MLAVLLGLVLLICKRYPEKPLARMFHRWFVELPVYLAHRVERKHIILVLVVLSSGQVMAALGPELALAYAAEMSLYVDAILATAAATAIARLRSVARHARAAMLRFFPVASRNRMRAPRTRKSNVRPASPSNDDDPDWWSVARAA